MDPWWDGVALDHVVRTGRRAQNNYLLSLGVGKGVVPLAMGILTQGSLREAQSRHDDAVAGPCDSDESGQDRREQLGKKEHEREPRSPGPPGRESRRRPRLPRLPRISCRSSPGRSSRSSLPPPAP